MRWIYLSTNQEPTIYVSIPNFDLSLPDLTRPPVRSTKQIIVGARVIVRSSNKHPHTHLARTIVACIDLLSSYTKDGVEPIFITEQDERQQARPRAPLSFSRPERRLLSRLWHLLRLGAHVHLFLVERVRGDCRAKSQNR